MPIVKSGPIGLGNPAGTLDDEVMTMSLSKGTRTMSVQVYHRVTPPYGGQMTATRYRGMSGSLQGYTDHILQSYSSYLDKKLSITKTLYSTSVGEVSTTYGWNESNGYPANTFFDTSAGGHIHFSSNTAQVIPGESTYNGPITPGVYISGSGTGFGTTSNISSPGGHGQAGGGGVIGSGTYFPPIFTYQNVSYSITQLLWFKNTQQTGPFDGSIPYSGSSLLSATNPDRGNFLVLSLKKYSGTAYGFGKQMFPKTLQIGSNFFNFADATMDFDDTTFCTFVWPLTSTQADALAALTGSITVKMTNPDRKNGIYEEFGGGTNTGTNIKLSDYYKGGTEVINSSAVGGTMPASGQIKLSDFYNSTEMKYFDQLNMNLTTTGSDYQFHAYDSFVRAADSIYSALANSDLGVGCRLTSTGVEIRISRGSATTLYVWEPGDTPGLGIGSNATRSIGGSINDDTSSTATANLISSNPTSVYPATLDSVKYIKLKWTVHNSTVLDQSDFTIPGGQLYSGGHINAGYLAQGDVWKNRYDLDHKNGQDGIGITFNMDAQAYSNGVIEDNRCDIDFELWVQGNQGWDHQGSATKIAEFSGRVQAYAEKPPAVGGGGSGSGSCFPAGALVTMSDGSKKPIETIQVGDMVKPHSEYNWDEGANEVLDFIERESEERLIFTINAPGVSLEVTQGHPILTTDGWKAIDVYTAREIHPEMDISKLKVGHTLRLILLDEESGEYGPSEQIIESIIEDARDIPVYNLNVTGNDTYIVNDVAVHNK